MLINMCLLPEQQTDQLYQVMLGNQQFKSLIRQFTYSTDHNISLLQELFLLLSPIVKSYLKHVKTADIEAAAAQPEVSHLKQMFFGMETQAGLLCFELMYFTGNAWTNPHIHPEYMVDEIITGRLEEHLYKKDQARYRFSKKHIRAVGDRRALYDPQGCPHNVKGLDTSCITLCLCLGTQPMQLIEVTDES